eukprot:Opistho-2@27368
MSEHARPGIYAQSVNGEPALIFPAETDNNGYAAPTNGSPDCRDPPNAATFVPVALSAASTKNGVLVAVAAVSESRTGVEMFKLEGTGVRLRLRWVGCLRSP